MSIGMYVLSGKTPVPCEDTLTWGRWMENTEGRVVAKTTIGDADVSTVFLGLDHRFGPGPPVLFETMVFGGQFDEYQERYETWEEAEAGHKRVCLMVSPPPTEPGRRKIIREVP